MNWLSIAPVAGAGLAGFLLGWLFAWLGYFRPRSDQLQARLAQAERDLAQLDQIRSELLEARDAHARADEVARRVPELERVLDGLRNENTRLVAELAALRKEREASLEKIQWLEQAEQKLRDAFRALASEVLQSNSSELLQQSRMALFEPMKQALEKLDAHVRELEQKREGAYQGLQEKLQGLVQMHAELQRTTHQLTQALKSPTTRGRWGEYQLRRVVELAGMTAHVDFSEQAGADTGRPDMVVHLPNQGVLPVDAKTPMEAYLRAVEAEDEPRRKECLVAHARAVRERVRELAQRKYWDQWPRAPELVVMFVPNEACLSAAFEADPELLDYAIAQRVLPVTPVTLLALLKAIAYGWQQHQVAENAREIAESGRDLYRRLAKIMEHFQRTGRSLAAAVNAYNDTVGSMERFLLPAARRLAALGSADGQLPELPQLDHTTRTPPMLEDGSGRG